ncbi:MAG: hypothetical protein CMP08_07655 [Xanthomonadales bacterium]|nr:hypothetical protein [Xanthomonadales bacterium]|tara:strand:+ start:1566 stop:1886 length:321 start_codon:yes stop_codon:yes gene_type:complete
MQITRWIRTVVRPNDIESVGLLYWRALVSALLRISLRLPLRVLAGLCNACALFFEALANQLMACDRLMHSITCLPYVKGIKAELARLGDDERRRVLRRLSASLDED